MLLISAPLAVYADSTLDHLNEEYQKLEQQQQAIKDKLNSTKTEKEKQQAIRDNLKNQITTTQKQINVLDNKINHLQNEITDQELALGVLSEEILVQQDFFAKRVRSLYKSSVNSNVLGRVLGVDSLSSYLSCGKYISRVSEHDNALLDSLADKMEEIRTLKAAMEKNQEELSETKNLAVDKKASLNNQKVNVESTLQDIKKMEAEYLANQEAIKKEMQQIQADIDAIYAGAEGNGSDVDFSKSGFIYPLQGRTYISSYYGPRFGGTDFHTGVDFPAPNNTPIRASASGKVIFVRTGAGYGRKWGYGNYIIVDHGGGFSTLYAHCSSIPLSVGDHVTKGQTIAYVGTTGWSTGYHVHFEVRINGSYTNPLNYL